MKLDTFSTSVTLDTFSAPSETYAGAVFNVESASAREGARSAATKRVVEFGDDKM
ncbi:hypothetical protein FACS1894122_05850 [Alphaproteobacteria bacterium]|nr:hypothetical protein FACS1894122_05850 [Alphaproteobacteria bacterium]